MADHLAQRFGTEKDRVNCPFYFKIGYVFACLLVRVVWCALAIVRAHALHMSVLTSPRCRACRHGDRCSRHHNKPNLSPTILLQNLYQNPSLNAPLGPDGLPIVVDGKYVQDDYEVRPWPGLCLVIPGHAVLDIYHVHSALK